MAVPSMDERRRVDRRKPRAPGEPNTYFGPERRKGDRRAHAAAEAALREQSALKPQSPSPAKLPPSPFEMSDETRIQARRMAGIIVGLCMLVMLVPTGVKLMVGERINLAPVASAPPVNPPPGMTAETAALLAAQAKQAAKAEVVSGWSSEPAPSEPASPAFSPPPAYQPSEPEPSASMQPPPMPSSPDPGFRPQLQLSGRKPL